MTQSLKTSLGFVDRKVGQNINDFDTNIKIFGQTRKDFGQNIKYFRQNPKNYNLNFKGFWSKSEIIWSTFQRVK